MNLRSFELNGADGKLIRGDRLDGENRQILFITGFLSKRWGNKSKALAQWCQELGWGFCCYDVRGFGESEGAFTDYTLSDWMADARGVVSMLRGGPRLTIVGNSLGGWIAWLMAQEFEQVERLILIAPAFNMMGIRAKLISAERRHNWHSVGWMPWDDGPLHKDWPLSWKWVEESEAYWKTSFDRLRPVKTTILHGLEDRVILPEGSRQFVDQLLARAPGFPIELCLIPGDHRLVAPSMSSNFTDSWSGRKRFLVDLDSQRMRRPCLGTEHVSRRSLRTSRRPLPICLLQLSGRDHRRIGSAAVGRAEHVIDLDALVRALIPAVVPREGHLLS